MFIAELSWSTLLGNQLKRARMSTSLWVCGVLATDLCCMSVANPGLSRHSREMLMRPGHDSFVDLLLFGILEVLRLLLLPIDALV